jgi:hypothetical protein
MQGRRDLARERLRLLGESGAQVIVIANEVGARNL